MFLFNSLYSIFSNEIAPFHSVSWVLNLKPYCIHYTCFVDVANEWTEFIKKQQQRSLFIHINFNYCIGAAATAAAAIAGCEYIKVMYGTHEAKENSTENENENKAKKTTGAAHQNCTHCL